MKEQLIRFEPSCPACGAAFWKVEMPHGAQVAPPSALPRDLELLPVASCDRGHEYAFSAYTPRREGGESVWALAGLVRL